MIIYYQDNRKDSYMNLPLKIKQLREDKDWSQTQLALKAGLKREYIGAIENGRVLNPGSDKLVKLAKALDVDENELLEAAGIKPPVPKLDSNPAVKKFTYFLLGQEATEEEVGELEAIAKIILSRHGTRRNP